MSVNINLVDSKNSDSARREKIKKIRAVSFGVLFLTAFLAVIIFALDYRFSASYVKKQEAEVLRELDTYNDISAKLFIVNTKLFDIAKLLAKRTSYFEEAKTITDGIKGDILITEYTTNEKGTVMTIQTDSLTELDDYLNYLVDLTNGDEFSVVALESLNADDAGYRVELAIK